MTDLANGIGGHCGGAVKTKGIWGLDRVSSVRDNEDAGGRREEN